MFRAARGTRPGVLRSLHGNATLWAGSSGSSLAAQATPTADTTVTASAHSAKRRTTSLRACRFMSPSPFTDMGPAAGSGGPPSVVSARERRSRFGSSSFLVLGAERRRGVVDLRAVSAHGAQRVDAAVPEALVVPGEADVDGARHDAVGDSAR